VTLRGGITTGACAAAAAKAAVMTLAGAAAPQEVEITLPGGQRLRVPVLYANIVDDKGQSRAAVRKDAGDDPDDTHGLEIVATVSWSNGDQVTFAAGEGVGMVTKPGLQVAPGEPAINPVPRQMIAAAVRDVTPRGVHVEIAIPGGREVARRTFNPRLGIEGGLSILGTSGIVRPYCTKALHDALKCALDVAAACGIRAPVLVPGNIGAKAVKAHFSCKDEQVIEVGNAWGFVLELLPSYQFPAIMLLGHPGKLAKLAARQWDTHSSQSEQATASVGCLCAEVLHRPAPDSPTVEGIFTALEAADRKLLADELARRVQQAVVQRLAPGGPDSLSIGVAQPQEAQSTPLAAGAAPIAELSRPPNNDAKTEFAVVLVNMAGQSLGSAGDLKPWQ
jgi:cobalt-precorrin-5B (C1)-methyltransferase